MKIFLDTNIFPEFIDRRVTTGSGHFVTVTKYPDPDVTLPVTRPTITLKKRWNSLCSQKNALPLQHEE
jgi:hypothetical protein